MDRYSVTIQYDANDRIYIASIPELKGCKAHGDTKEQALEEIKVALELWLEVAEEEGLFIPKPILYAG